MGNKEKKVLITGGIGFIGSHTIIELDRSGFEFVVIDDFRNSKRETLLKIENIIGKSFLLYNIDACSELEVEKLFIKHNFYGVMHFAGLKAVGESVKKPIEYYFNNIMSTINLAKLCIKYDVNTFIFSSSATVYGEQKSPLDEKMELMRTSNPYGETKAIAERILIDITNANPNFSVTLLRYFNPIGAHGSGMIGENPNGLPNNLMPLIVKVAKGEVKELKIFGDDYDTIDGTGVRDYIHVVDLAKGHVSAMKKRKLGVSIYNLGTGYGVSVLELVHTFESVNNVSIPYKIVNRRTGDLATVYADVSKANRDLGWNATKTLEDMCRDAWNFTKANLKK